MNRSEALKVTCPKCGAPPRMPCMGKKAERKACHIERHPNCWNGRKAPSNHTRERRCNEIGWVYLVSAPGTGTVKIGYSAKEPRNRVKSLQTANPTELRLLSLVRGSRRDEQKYHRQFAHLRVRGEWFRDEPELREHFGEMLG
jgi:hypothetical protein